MTYRLPLGIGSALVLGLCLGVTGERKTGTFKENRDNRDNRDIHPSCTINDCILERTTGTFIPLALLMTVYWIKSLFRDTVSGASAATNH
jgi:hypothetical protein